MQYRASQYAFQQACRDAKTSHWRTYLANLSAKDLFTAAKYTNGPAATQTLPPLRKQDGQLTSDPKEQANLLFQATGGPTIPCDLSDVGAAPPRPSFNEPFTTEEIQQTIKKLKLNKAPGTDEVTNQVIKAAPEALATVLAELLNQCTELGQWPEQWKLANTIILKEAGKPDYTDAGAYRPIALLSCLSKVLESTIAQCMQQFAEENQVLPEGHCGGRAQRSTTDALLNLTLWVKNQWARGKTVGTLFVDVKAAFPTVNPTRLCDTLHKMGFCPSLIKLTSHFLSNRSTTFQLGDYRSSPKQLTIGLPQGLPLLVILYILYNTPLLQKADGMADTISLGFIDDVAFATAHATVDGVQNKLQTLADRELAWGSQYGAAFDKAKSQWMILSNKKLTDPLPTLTLGDIELKPQPLIKWLGVLIDPKLRFAENSNALAAKGAKVVNQLSSLARTGWGIPLRQSKQVIASLVHSWMDYAGVVWHQYGKQNGAPSKIQKVDNAALRFALGAFRTHPTPFLQHNTASALVHARLTQRF